MLPQFSPRLFLLLFLFSVANLQAQNWKSLKKLETKYMESGEFTKANETGMLELEKCLQKFGPYDYKYGQSLHDLGNIKNNLGKFDEAIVLLKKSEKVRVYSNNNLHLINDLATLYEITGDYNKALEGFRKLLITTKHELGQEHINYSISLNNLGGCYKSMGNYNKALAYYQASLESIAKSSNKESSTYALSLNNVASAYESLGKYEKALPLYLEAISIIEKTEGKISKEYGNYINNLAGLYCKLNMLDEAEKMYKEALEIALQTSGKESNYYITYISNLAHLYSLREDYAKALPLDKEALEMTILLLGKKNPDYQKRLNNVAVTLSLMDSTDVAIKLLKDAISDYRNSGLENFPDYGIALNNLGYLYYKSNQTEEAINAFQLSISVKEKIFERSHPDVTISFNSLGNCYYAAGKIDDALKYYLEGRTNLYNQIQNNFTILNETQKESFFNNKILATLDIYKSFYSNCYKLNPVIGDYFYNDELIQKGLLLQSSLAIQQALLSSKDSALITSFNDLTNKKNILMRQSVLPLKERTVNTDSLKNVISSLENSINTKASGLTGFNGFFDANISWKDVQSRLSPGEAAIEFSSYREYRLKYTGNVFYYALIIRAESLHPQVVYLFEEKDLGELIQSGGKTLNQTFVNQLYGTKNRAVSSNSNPLISSSELLFEMIWKPLLPFLEGIKTVNYAPTGLLNSIAFSAIRDNSGDMLCEKYKLVALTSTRNLIKNQNESFLPSSAVLYGGIEYNADSAKLSSTLVKKETGNLASRGFTTGPFNSYWYYLPGTLSEVNNIERIMKSGDLKVKKITGFHATEENYKQLAGVNSPGIIHFATHGFYFPSSSGRENPDDNSMQRSGLLLAGANNTWNGTPLPAEIEDGVLTATEISQTWLGGTQLAALSACETGLGDIKGGEGVFGLQRAFKLAGVEYILMALWEIPDNETSEFMKLFYGFWIGGDNLSECFRETQNVMKDKYDPYFWAGFVLVK